MAGKGGKTVGAGRPPGSRNKSTLQVKELAQEHGPTAIKTLARLAKQADTDAAKIAACRELLDRAYGKAPQALTGEDGGAVHHIHELIIRGVRPDSNDRHS